MVRWCNITGRVRTILVLGYWVLDDICRYWIVLLLGDINFCCDTQYDTDRTTVGTIHMFLPRDASAERSYEIACRPSVCLSVCNVSVPCSNRFEFFENNFTAE